MFAYTHTHDLITHPVPGMLCFGKKPGSMSCRSFVNIGEYIKVLTFERNIFSVKYEESSFYYDSKMSSWSRLSSLCLYHLHTDLSKFSHPCMPINFCLFLEAIRVVLAGYGKERRRTISEKQLWLVGWVLHLDFIISFPL